MFRISLISQILETEVHEGTLVECLSMLSQWSSRMSSDIPPKFVEWLPKAVAAKASTSPVRSAYFMCLFKALKGSGTLTSALPLIPTLLKAVENAAKQPSQAATVGEGIHAAACLVKLSLLETETEAKLADFWKMASEKDLFNNERFLAAASPEALASGAALAEKALMRSGRESDNSPWLRVLAAALLCPGTEARRCAAAAVKRVVGGLGGDQLAVELVVELEAHLARPEQAERIDFARDRFPAEPPGGSLATHVVQVLETVAAACGKGQLGKEKAVAFARALLNPCHSETVYHTDPALWGRLVAKVSGAKSAKTVVGDLCEIQEDMLSGKVRVEAARSLVNYNPDAIVPGIVERLAVTLKDPGLVFSAKDYQIFLTPKGELFDKQFLDNLIKSGEAAEKNVKRENKAYSYKEQMEEIALRKELEEKRRREGKVVEPKLTPKQKEALNTQLEKEEAKRQEVAALKEASSPILRLSAEAVRARPRAFAGKVDQVLSALFAGMRSPVAAEECCGILRDLRKSAFPEEEDETLAQLAAAAALYVKQPACELPGPALSSSSAVKDLTRTVVTKVGEMSLASLAPDPDMACPMGTPAFAFVFPVFEHAVKKSLKDEDFIKVSCQVLKEHCGLRGSLDEDGEEEDSCSVPDDLHPKHLPLEAMLRLVSEVVASTGGRVQQVAAGTFVEVCDAASGKPGCASAGEKELRVVLGTLQSEVPAMRDAGLRGFRNLLLVLPDEGRDRELREEIVRRLWVSRFDVEEEIAELGKSLWEESGFETDAYPGLSMGVIGDVTHPVSCVRSAGADALAALLEEDRGSVGAILAVLLDTYRDKLTMTKPVMDHLGRVVQDAVDHWEPRSGVAVALKKLAPFYESSDVAAIADFLVPTALDDRNESVRNSVLDAAVHVVDTHGKQTAGELLPVFERFMDQTASSTTHDNARQSVVILMGSLAKHLDPTDPKVRPIIRQLIIALNTPSQQVQEAVAQCLPPLVPAIKEEAPDIISSLIETLLGSKFVYGERKGAAHGIAGIVKGLGILSLKQLDIMGRLTTAIQDKKNPSHREGALFAFEMLCSMLGRLFEPYIVHILPHLLLCFGDSVEHVRQVGQSLAFYKYEFFLSCIQEVDQV